MAIMGSPIYLFVCLIPLCGILAAPNVIRPSFNERTIAFPDPKSKCEVLDDIVIGNYSNGNSGSGIDYDGEIVVRVLTTRAHTEDICAMMYNATRAFCRLANEKQSMIRLKQVKSQFKSRFGITNELCEDLNRNERIPTFAESARYDDAKTIASLIFCQLRLKMIDEKKPLCSYFASPNVRPSSDSFSLSRVRRSDPTDNENQKQIAVMNNNENVGGENKSTLAISEGHGVTTETSKLPESQDSATETPKNDENASTEFSQTAEASSKTEIEPSSTTAIEASSTTATPELTAVNHDERTPTDPPSTVATVVENDDQETDDDDEQELTFDTRLDNGPEGRTPDGWQKHSADNDDDNDDDDTPNHENLPTNDGFHGKTFTKNDKNIPANGGSQEATSTTIGENLPTNDGLQNTTTIINVPLTNAAGTLLGTYTMQSIIFGLLLAHVNFDMIINSIS